MSNIASLDTSESKISRIKSLDALRGLIIILMALDHANHFVAQKHPPGELWGGTFPSYQDGLSFLTRLVTHLSPPGFAFLMGIGMLLFANSRIKRGWSKWAITKHFLVRGGLLIGLQLLVVNRAWELSPQGWELEVYVGVLVALGGGMILGSLLVWLKPRHLLPLVILLVLGIELLTPQPDAWGQQFHWLSRVLLIPGGDLALWVYYPILQWLEFIAFGMLFGNWLLDDSRKALGNSLKLGAAFLLGFVLIRSLDGFGNIRPRGGDTWIDVFNVVKYPPSITYGLLTMGVIMFALWALSRAKIQRVLGPLAVFGQAPLFFYILHLFLYAGMGWLLTPEGTSIPAMYPLWLLGLAILYPLCLLYGRVKHRQPANSILRFL